MQFHEKKNHHMYDENFSAVSKGQTQQNENAER